MKKIFTTIKIIIIGSLLVGGVFWGGSFFGEDQTLGEGVKADGLNTANVNAANLTAGFSNITTGFSVDTTPGSAVSTFKNTSPKFSLEYPKDLVSSVVKDNDGAVTFKFTKIVTKAGENSTENSAEKTGFQIFVSPYKEKVPVDAKLVREAFPTLQIKNPVPILFGVGNSVQGLAFESSDPSIGDTRELWFVHEGYLYQVTTYFELDSWLAEIFKSWKF